MIGRYDHAIITQLYEGSPELILKTIFIIQNGDKIALMNV